MSVERKRTTLGEISSFSDNETSDNSNCQGMDSAISAFNKMAKVCASEPMDNSKNTRLINQIEGILGYSANTIFKLDFQNQDILDFISFMMEIVSNPTSSPSLVKKIISICLKLCAVPVMRDYLQHEVMICIPISIFILRDLLRENEMSETLILLDTVTNEVHFDYVPCSLHRLFQCLTSLRKKAYAQEFVLLVISIQNNLCRRDESFLSLLEPTTDLKLALKAKMDQFSLHDSSFKLKCFGLIFSSVLLKENTIDVKVLEVMMSEINRGMTSEDGKTRNTAAVMFSSILTKPGIRAIISSQFDLVVPFQTFVEQIDENDPSPSSTCQYLLDVLSTFPALFGLGKIKYLLDISSGEISKLLCSWMLKPIEENHSISLSCLKLVLYIIKVLMENKEDLKDFPFTSNVIQILPCLLREVVDVKSIYFKFVAQKLLVVLSILLKLSITDKGCLSASASLIQKLIESLIDQLDMAKTSIRNLSVEVFLSALHIYHLHSSESVHSGFLDSIFQNPGFAEYITHALSTGSNNLFYKAILVLSRGISEATALRIESGLTKRKSNCCSGQCKECQRFPPNFPLSFCSKNDIFNGSSSDMANLQGSSIRSSDLTALYQNSIEDLSKRLRQTQILHESKTLYLEKLEENYSTWKKSEGNLLDKQVQLRKELKEWQKLSEENQAIAEQVSIAKKNADSDLNDIKKKCKLLAQEKDNMTNQYNELLIRMENSEKQIHSYQSDIEGQREMKSLLEKQIDSLADREKKQTEIAQRLEMENQKLQTKLKESDKSLQGWMEKYMTFKDASTTEVNYLKSEMAALLTCLTEKDQTIIENKATIEKLMVDSQRTEQLVAIIRDLTTGKTHSGAINLPK